MYEKEYVIISEPEAMELFPDKAETLLETAGSGRPIKGKAYFVVQHDNLVPQKVYLSVHPALVIGRSLVDIDDVFVSFGFIEGMDDTEATRVALQATRMYDVRAKIKQPMNSFMGFVVYHVRAKSEESAKALVSLMYNGLPTLWEPDSLEVL